jgi:hypothetical protein
MKSISLVIPMALALLVSAHSRTLVQPLEKAQATRPASDNLITQATQKGTDAPLIATPQDAKKAIQEGTLGKIASKASNSLRNYPSWPQIRRIGNPKIRNILERGRKLLEAGKAANGWNATRLSGFASQVDQYLKEAEAAAKSAKPTGNSPVEDCGMAKDRCNQGCHDRDAGFFCFVDCRIEYIVCLGILFHTSGREALPVKLK